jgi:hypothetical protein
MLTKKVKMCVGYLHISGMVYDCKWIEIETFTYLLNIIQL